MKLDVSPTFCAFFLPEVFMKAKNPDQEDDREIILQCDDIPVSLKEALDLNKLKSQNGEGVVFEVNPDQGEDLVEENEPLFPKDDVVQSWCGEDDDSDDSDSNSTQFESVAKKMEDITEAKDGGVLKRIIKQGTGNVIPHAALVRVHFNGFLEYADDPYDSSRLRGDPQRFRLGLGEVIPGWDIAIATMKKGELSQFLIQSDYAYGKMGCPPRVPAEATVLFEIEVLDFIDQEGVSDYYMMTREERQNVTYDVVKKVVRAERLEGKQLFSAEQYRKALQKYRKASEILENYHLKNDEEERQQQKDLLTVFINMALCCTRLKMNGRAIVYCKKALDIDRNNAKALYFLGQGYHNMGEFERAKVEYRRAQKFEPKSADIRKKLHKLEEDMRNFKIVEKEMYGRMFKSTPKPSQQDEQREAAVMQQYEDAEAKSLRCTDEFKAVVNTKLQEFLDDKDLEQLPFPCYNLTVGEINYILEATLDFGLDTRQQGSGAGLRIVIMKKPSQT